MSRTIEAIMRHTAAPAKREAARTNGKKIYAQWQSEVETFSGFGQMKLRFTFARAANNAVDGLDE